MDSLPESHERDSGADCFLRLTARHRLWESCEQPGFLRFPINHMSGDSKLRSAMPNWADLPSKSLSNSLTAF
jgi:hypothetical protein